MSAIHDLLRAVKHDDLKGFVSVGRQAEDGPDWVFCGAGYHRVDYITPDNLHIVTRFDDDEADVLRGKIVDGRLKDVVSARLVPWSHFIAWLAREFGGSLSLSA